MPTPEGPLVTRTWALIPIVGSVDDQVAIAWFESLAAIEAFQSSERAGVQKRTHCGHGVCSRVNSVELRSGKGAQGDGVHLPQVVSDLRARILKPAI